ncbi:MAG: triose-phosphate isomerase, partial [Candidatus Omnitrophica bacterium]|nr:triose-phosphate isomerase [Candidatus Omnitrophota bacterium]
PIIAGNWKMYKTAAEAEELVSGFKKALGDVQDVEIVVCPPYTSLAAAARVIHGSNISLGAQDVYWEDSGAYTGEISCPMLKELGCQFVIIGHSERRQYFGETNQGVNKKAKAVLSSNLTPIICVGERLEQREKGETFKVIEDHVKNGLKDITEEQARSIILAYEPVWAIGTGRTALPEQAQEAHHFIRQLLKKLYTQELADVLRIQYGGSVKPGNISDLMAQEDVDGALVGGASLKVDSFVGIIKGAL